MSEIRLQQPGFTCSVCEQFARNKLKIQKFMDSGDWRYNYENKLDKLCFQHDLAYGGFKDLLSRTTPGIWKRYKVFDIAKNPKYDGYHRGLASMICKSFDKKSFSTHTGKRIYSEN